MRILLILILLVSCAEVARIDPPKPPPIVPAVVVTPKTGETDLEALRRERKEALATISQLQSKVVNLNSQINTVEEDQVKWWSKLIGGIAIGLAAICLVASFFTLQYPILPTILRYSSYILGSIGTLAFVFAAMYGYFLAIGIGVAVILVGTAIWLWNNDRRALKQVVGVVEEHKHDIVDYKNKFKSKIDSRADRWLNRIRGK